MTTRTSSPTLNVPTTHEAPVQAQPMPPQTHPGCHTCNDAWIETHTHEHNDGSWGVPSSNGRFVYYWVRSDENTLSGYSCTCPAFWFQYASGLTGTCKHIRQVLRLIELGVKHDLPQVLWHLYMLRFDFSTDALYD